MKRPKQYEGLEVSELFCPRCQKARPVRRHLLLVLPTGNQYEYRCQRCGETVGSESDNDRSAFSLVDPGRSNE